MNALQDEWKGMHLIRSPRREDTAISQRDQNTGRKLCLVAACNNTLSPHKVSCLCQNHAHKPGLCRCARCVERRLKQ